MIQDAIDGERKWYVRRGEVTLGPFSVNDIAERIARCELVWLDWAIRAGETRWRILDEVPGLRGRLGCAVDSSSPLSEQWTFLRAGKGSGQRLWFGPWTLSMARERLKNGALRYGDFAWRPGFSSWRRLGDLEEFGASAEARAVDLGPVASERKDVCADELLKNVVYVDELRLARDQAPAEAAGEDLVSMPDWVKVILTSLLAVLTVASPRLAGAAGLARSLQILPLKLTGDQPSLVLQTDAAVGEPIVVTIHGRTGEILSLPSFFHTLQVKRQPGEVPTVRLDEFKLPNGRYQIEASVGEVRATSSIFIGVDNESFKEELARHMKQISGEQQLEKKTLFYASRDLAAAASRLSKRASRVSAQAKWKVFYTKWRSELAGARAPLDRLMREVKKPSQAFPDRLEELKNAADRLQKIAADFDRVVSQARDPASLKGFEEKPDASALESEFQKIARDSALLSANSSSSSTSLRNPSE